MTFGKAYSPAVIIIFGIIISVAFFSRASCEANELFYQPVCCNTQALNIVPPEFPIQNNIGCDKHDKKAIFESVVAYFLERHESSPPS